MEQSRVAEAKRQEAVWLNQDAVLALQELGLQVHSPKHDNHCGPQVCFAAQHGGGFGTREQSNHVRRDIAILVFSKEVWTADQLKLLTDYEVDSDDSATRWMKKYCGVDTKEWVDKSFMRMFAVKSGYDLLWIFTKGVLQSWDCHSLQETVMTSPTRAVLESTIFTGKRILRCAHVDGNHWVYLSTTTQVHPLSN